MPTITKLTASNYPNPFNPNTNISFSIPNNSHVKIDIYNIKGQRVKELLNEPKTAGEHKVVWTGVDEKGRKVSSGIYFYRVRTEDSSVTKKMMLLK